VALVVPEWEAVRHALSISGEDYPDTREELASFPAAVKIVQHDVALLTKSLADYERVRKIALLPNEFSIDNGELTPTLKVKRRIIDEKFGDVIDRLYS
jgi:long-chain acyl-CoA synthetase